MASHWRKHKNICNRLIRKSKWGKYVVDCRYHPCIVTESNPSYGDITVKSLLNGKYNGCSIMNCGILPISEKEAIERTEFIKKEGFCLYLQKFEGYTDEDIEQFKRLDKEYNYDIGN